MHNVETKFFIGEGPEAEAIIKSIWEKIRSVQEKSQQIADSHGAVCCAERSGKVFGLCFRTVEVQANYLKKHTVGPLPDPKGPLWIYLPKLNCKAGKELVAQFEALENVSFSDEVIKRLHLERMVAGFKNRRAYLVRSVAGCYGNKLLVKIPHMSEQEKPAGGPDVAPVLAVPTWLRPCRESEFLAVQENAVSNAAQADQEDDPDTPVCN